MGRDDGDFVEFCVFYVMVSVYLLMREVELEFGSVYRDFGLEFR